MILSNEKIIEKSKFEPMSDTLRIIDTYGNIIEIWPLISYYRSIQIMFELSQHTLYIRMIPDLVSWLYDFALSIHDTFALSMQHIPSLYRYMTYTFFFIETWHRLFSLSKHDIHFFSLSKHDIYFCFINTWHIISLYWYMPCTFALSIHGI
jgi:hypothetical protein